MSACDTLERVSAARTYLTAKVPFLGFMALRLRPRVAQPEDRVPTAAVGPDGTLVLNAGFVASLTNPQLRGLLAHEVLHPAMQFFERRGSKHLAGWNIAHDHAINLIIEDFISRGLRSNIQLPPKGLLNTKYQGMAAEEIYNDLPDEQKSGAGQNTVIVVVEGKEGEEGGDGKGKGIGQDCRPDLATTKDGRSAGRGDTSAQERLERTWQVQTIAAAQVHEQQKGRGSLPGSLRILIDEMLTPKVNWLTLLSQWLGEHAGKPDLTYMRPSRRSAAVGEILMGNRRKSYPDVTVFWDTSGSMSGEEKRIFPEIAFLCEDLDLTLRVLIIDTTIHADLTDVKEAEEVAEALAGGGGSDFCPAFDLLDEERNDSVVLAFTDGYIGVPQLQPESLKGVVWVLTGGGSDPTRGGWGQVLKLDDAENGEWG
jgi:predicted metal-dependent peptidase